MRRREVTANPSLGQVTRRRQNAVSTCRSLPGGRQFPVVVLRQEMRIGRCVDQLDCDAHSIARSLHAAFEDLGHSELIGDRLHRQLRVAKLLDGRASFIPGDASG